MGRIAGFRQDPQDWQETASQFSEGLTEDVPSPEQLLDEGYVQGGKIRLREVVTGEQRLCHSASGYQGRRGQLGMSGFARRWTKALTTTWR